MTTILVWAAIVFICLLVIFVMGALILSGEADDRDIEAEVAALRGDLRQADVLNEVDCPWPSKSHSFHSAIDTGGGQQGAA
jgi:hypothetical protein